MKILDVLKYSGRSLKVQRGRTVLTVLGVMIGITTIVVLNSLVGGFSNLLNGQLSQGLSAQTLTVTGGGGGLLGFGGGGGGVAATLYTTNLTGPSGLESYLKKNGNYVDEDMGIIQPTSFKPYYNSSITGNLKSYSATIIAVDFTTYSSPDFYSSTFTTTGGNGTIPTDNKSIVIGYGLYHPYDNDSSAHLINYGQNLTLYWHWTNKTSTLQSYSVNITGVLGQIGGISLASLAGGPSDRELFMPITMAEQIFQTNILSSIVVHVNSKDQTIIDNVTATIKAFFAPSGSVSVLSATAQLSTLNSALGLVSDLLTGIALISLLVAGINIVNIMTMSVLERTREIGILKAIGAKDSHILGIFLVEAFLIGLIASLIGIALGYLGSTIVGGLLFRTATGAASGFSRGGGFLSGFVPSLSWDLILEAIGFGVGTSVIFALYPAIKASRKPPVEALRYE